MKKIICLIALLVVATTTAQKKEVQNTIETFFSGFHQRDSLKMKAVSHPKLLLQSIAEDVKGTELIFESAKEFFITIATIPRDMKIEERILSYNIQVDGAMAHAWTPYEFYVNGKLSHKGVNAFTLFKDGSLEASGWKIIHIVDTRHY